ncbi:hypothetical protein [Pontibacillus marinus]|uniref:Uncharacterized protein n=1 Tax=Pontibacillus marinus BH030004 = DSM 16465 TaxID=1385511 RepID=A0A0A5HSQ3_9BACI|nr:hypothetical protein [Pontibacillus marinus]KGX86677.1 hypothetical protein N783_11825 [Pontibacillus marinus BH030004 = DSM 16465]
MWKKIILIMICLVVLVPMSASAEILYMNYPLPEKDSAKKSGAWLQGFITQKDRMVYFYNRKIKELKKGKSRTLYELNNLKDELKPYDLHLNNSINSFILGDMDIKDGDLYVSGLIFRDAQSDRKKLRGQYVVGETYSILFKVNEEEDELLHIGLAKTHLGNDNSYVVHDNATGMPMGEPSEYEDRYFDPILHFKNISLPRFTFHDDKIVFVQRREIESPYRKVNDILLIQEKRTKRLARVLLDNRDNYKNPVMLAYIKDDKLIINDDEGYYTQDLKNNHKVLDKLSYIVKYTSIQSNYPFTDIDYDNGKVLLIDKMGFMKLKGKDKVQYIVHSSALDYKIKVTYFDWNAEKGVLYTNDFLRRHTFWSFRPTKIIP